MRLRKLREIVKADIPLFDFDYPMLAEHRKEFERKFVLNFYDYFINFESITEFKRHLQSRLLNIMPKYVKLYQTENMINDPFVNFFTTVTQNSKEDNALIEKYIESLTAETLNKLNIALQSIQDNVKNITSNSDSTVDNMLENKSGDEQRTSYSDTEKYTRDLNTDTTDTNKQDYNENSTAETDETQNTKTNETQSTDSENVEKFSDTPQVNFVVGNGIRNADGSYTPISSYATTLTDTSSTSDSEREATEDITKNSTGNSTVDRDITEEKTHTEKTTIEDNKDNNGNKTVTTNTTGTQTGNETSESNTAMDESGNTKINSAQEQRNNTKTDSAKIANRNRNEKLTKDTITVNKGFQNENISKLLEDYRHTLINIDEMIFNDCRNLFLGVWI